MVEEEGAQGCEMEMESESANMPLSAVEGMSLEEGNSLFCVVKEEWGEMRGFVIWELENSAADVEALRDCENSRSSLRMEAIDEKFRGRMWIHEGALIDRGQKKENCQNLMDKTFPAPLGKPGERRFAPRVGRSGFMSEVVPGDEGDFWLLLNQDDFGSPQKEFLDSTGRKRSPTFVFRTEKNVVDLAYEQLEKWGDVNEEEGSDQEE